MANQKKQTNSKTKNVYATMRKVVRASKQVSVQALVLLLALGVNGVGVFGVADSFAYYHDTETSTSNVFMAALLDFELATVTIGSTELDPGETFTKEVTVVDTDSIDFKYVVKSVQTGGDTAFCEALDLVAFLEGGLQYSGPLLGFMSATSTFSSSTDDWQFDVTLPAHETGFTGGETCEVDFIYNGWQERYDGIFDGYHDEERVDEVASTKVPDQCVVIDFETDALGGEIKTGQPIDDEFALWGMTVSAVNNDPHHNKEDLAITFDSASPTGGDFDLGTPNQDFGGPGVGTGGESGAPGENSEELDNMLIIAQSSYDGNNDGLIDVPNDEYAGGELIFTFDEPTYVEGLTLIDIDGGGEFATVKLYGTSTLISTTPASGYGNNSVEDILLDTADVTKIEVFFKRSGAVDNLCVTQNIEKPNAFVVLNEVLPKPKAADPAPNNREFIELYNNGMSAIDVANWRISELAAGTEVFYPIVATGATTTEVYSYTGTTVIPSKGSIIVQFGAANQRLNNSGDTIRLYDDTNTLLDTYTYTSSIKGKSDARIPDGVGGWVDPEPTPGAPNVVTERELEDAGFSEEEIIDLLDLEEEVVEHDDAEPPVITLISSSTIRVALGKEYRERGARATDNEDVRVEMEVYSEDVYVDEVGVYEVMYVAFDDAGNMGSAVRTVVVYDPSLEAVEPPTEEDVLEEADEEVRMREEEPLETDGLGVEETDTSVGSAEGGTDTVAENQLPVEEPAEEDTEPDHTTGVPTEEVSDEGDATIPPEEEVVNTAETPEVVEEPEAEEVVQEEVSEDPSTPSAPEVPEVDEVEDAKKEEEVAEETIVETVEETTEDPSTPSDSEESEAEEGKEEGKPESETMPELPAETADNAEV